ncbi:hypothetical protein PTKIN_Ptkin01aG0309100 [Pterospermum kingtungense]
MNDFGRPSHRDLTCGDGRNNNIEIIDANMLKYVNKVYFGRTEHQQPPFDPPSFAQKPVADKKRRNKSSSSSSLSIKSWWNDPNVKRKRRLTKYKMYALEGKLKDSLKKGQRWIKRKFRKIVHGY